jgi:predicted ribonuclease YlaK
MRCCLVLEHDVIVPFSVAQELEAKRREVEDLQAKLQDAEEVSGPIGHPAASSQGRRT